METPQSQTEEAVAKKDQDLMNKLMNDLSEEDQQVTTFLLSPACGRRRWSGDYKMPSVCVCVLACVRSSRFLA